MIHPTAYLSFNGTCREAMTFYAQALDATIGAMLNIAQTPCATQMKSNQELIMHARLDLPGGGQLMAGDHHPDHGPYPGMKGFTLTLSYDTCEEAERRFAALSEGGTVTMPMQPSFWAKTFGMVNDRFGTPWIVNGELLEVQPT